MAQGNIGIQYIINNPNTYSSGNLTASGQTVAITVTDGHASWDVYLSGTFSSGSTVAFEGSPDSTNWHSLNGRRNSDSSTNDTTSFLDVTPFGGVGPLGANPSNWRGNCAGIRYFRVRCATFQSGDSISVQVITSVGNGATFSNAAQPAGTNLIGFIGNQFTFQASNGRAYGSSSLVLSPTVSASSVNIFTLYNPPVNTKSLYVYRLTINGTFGAINGVGQFDRYRFTQSVAPTGGTTNTPVSRNGSSTASIASVKRAVLSGNSITSIPVTGVTALEKSLIITTGGSDTSTEDGSLIITPGNGIVVRYTTAVSATSICCEIVWHEI